jgi:transposase
MTSRRNDPDTSAAAAAAIEEHTSVIQQQILWILDRFRVNGLTTREIEHHVGIEFATVTPRMVAMEEHGWIKRTQFRRRAPKGKGVGIVWQITPKGIGVLL